MEKSILNARQTHLLEAFLDATHGGPTRMLALIIVILMLPSISLSLERSETFGVIL